MLLGTCAFIRVKSAKSLLGFLFLDRDRKGLGVFLRSVRTADESGVSLDEDDKGQDGRSDNGESHKHEGVLVFEVAESKSEADGSSVSSGSDNSGDGTGGRRVDVRDNSVRSTFGGLDKEGEEDHDGDGGSEGVGLGEDQDENTFTEEADGLGNKASTHSHVLVTHIGNESSKTAGEQVHESEN